MTGLTLWLCVETSPLSAFSTGVIMESVLRNCSLLSPYEFSNRTVLDQIKYRPHRLDTLHSTTVWFHRIFLPRDTQAWNGLTAAVFSGQYELSTLKKRTYSYLHHKESQRTCRSSGVTRGRGRR